MEAALVVYVISQLEKWSRAMSLGMILSGFGLVTVFLCFGIMAEKIAPKKVWVSLLILFLMFGAGKALLPNKQGAEMMAAAYGVQYAVQSKTGQQVLDKSGKIVNNVLDLAIQKTTPNK